MQTTNLDWLCCIFPSAAIKTEVIKEYLPPLGVSVNYLNTTFRNEVNTYLIDCGTTITFDSACIYDIEPLIRKLSKNNVCPKDGRMGSALVDCIGDENAGPSNGMLSYAWKNKLSDIVAILLEYCTKNQLDPSKTFIWICFACNNQHRVVERRENQDVVPFEEFEKIFSDCVLGINNVIALMSPWNHAEYLSRVWCVFEMFTALSKNCKLTIAMPEEQKRALVDSIQNSGAEKLIQTLSSTNVENAEASNLDDKVMILDLVNKGAGYNHFNGQVNKCMMEWVDATIEESLNKARNESKDPSKDIGLLKLLDGAGRVLFKTGRYEKAVILFQESLNIRKIVLGNDHSDLAISYHNIGSVHKKTKYFDAALACYNKSLAIRERELGDDHPDTGKSYNVIGTVYDKKGDYEKALFYYKKALAIFEKMAHSETSVCYYNIGLVYANKGDFVEALDNSTKSLTMKKSELGDEHPDTAKSYNVIGMIYEMMGDYDESIVFYKKALKTFEKVLGDKHPTTAKCSSKIKKLEET